MPKRSSTEDENQVATRIVALTTSDGVLDLMDSAISGDPPKNPAAVALGRLGGRKGGKARAKKLSAKRRSSTSILMTLALISEPTG